MEVPKHDLRGIGQTGAEATQRRFISGGIVVLLHVFLIWALVMGLKNQFIQKIADVIKVEVVKPPPPIKTPPPPPPPELKPPPPFMPPPEIVIEQPPPPTAITTQSVVKTPPPIAPVTQGTPPNIRYSDCRAIYPPEAQRMNQQGTVQVQFTVTATGEITNIVVLKSSGITSLDTATPACIQRAKALPAKNAQGQPMDVTKVINYKWQLK